MNIHQIIKEKRKALSLTQEQVASCLGVSTPAVSKWENGSTYLDITLLPALDKLHSYPTCENLIYPVVFYLHGAMLLYNIQEQEVYAELLEPFYKDLSASENPEIREQAVTMLISYHEERGEFKFAILYTRQGNYSEAVKLMLTSMRMFSSRYLIYVTWLHGYLSLPDYSSPYTNRTKRVAYLL